MLLFVQLDSVFFYFWVSLHVNVAVIYIGLIGDLVSSCSGRSLLGSINKKEEINRGRTFFRVNL